jgi:hypothetical protein
LAFGLAACSQTPDRRGTGTTPQGIQATPAELREIVKEAYIYGFPMADSYRIQYSYFVDQNNPEYKGAWNQPHSVARVYTPQDKAIQTPNSDTPYSFLGADLRAEPLVISVPAIPKDRYYSLQFIDMYTHNFAYVGSRATGSDAGHYLLTGPAWLGAVPDGVKSVIRSETDFVFVLYRTQLFGTSDLGEVKKIQAQYSVRPLSQFTGTASPPPADTGKRSSADGFGTREFLHNDYMARMASAVLGIYGNSKEEANYPTYFVDSERNPLNGATSRYTVKFEPGQLPPVNAFWSLTMYELPASLLTDNPIDRYLINSQMEPNLIRDAEGGITLYIQHESPGKSKEPNWLPAPKGPFFMVLREYRPKPEALNGSWKVPQAVRAAE